MNLKIALQQRVLPSYRVPFLDALAAACGGGLGVFAGQPRAEEMIESGAAPKIARLFLVQNRHLFRGSLYLCWQGGFQRFLEEWQPEALIVEANPRYLATPAAVRWMHTRQRPVIGWGLGAAPLNGGWPAGLRREVRRSFLHSFDALVAYSKQGAAAYAAQGFARERIFVAPNAVAPRPPQAAPVRPLASSSAPATVLFVGRLQERKRIDLLLRACAALPEYSQPCLWIVGDGPARAGLEDLAHTVYPRTEFWGACFGPELDVRFLQADLFVLPGTGGLAVQQAMSQALPVIVAEADGTQADLVRPGNGWRVPPGSLEALTNALTLALSDLPRLRRMGQESFRIVSEEINLETMVAGFLKAVEAVV